MSDSGLDLRGHSNRLPDLYVPPPCSVACSSCGLLTQITFTGRCGYCWLEQDFGENLLYVKASTDRDHTGDGMPHAFDATTWWRGVRPSRMKTILNRQPAGWRSKPQDWT